MRNLTHILDSHGINVEMLKTAKPGYTVYEDEFQVAAEPYSDTNT